MDILIIGGREFLGRYLVKSAFDRGHRVTLFNRGKTNPNLFEDVEAILGDRATNDIFKLAGRKWDVVIDTCGYVPSDIDGISKVLLGHIGQYIFISSCSVYDLNFEGYCDELGKLVNIKNDFDINERSRDFYGPKKLLCEQGVEALFGVNSLIVRPGLIVGPHDSTYRFPYWPERFRDGGNLLVPGKLSDPVQVIDVRDLAQWILNLSEGNINGVYNGVGDVNLTKGEFFKSCQSVVNSESSLTWISEEKLVDEKVGQWVELPLFLTKQNMGLMRMSNHRSLGNGLKYCALEKTIKDTLEWSLSIEDSEFRKKALSREREKELLELFGS